MTLRTHTEMMLFAALAMPVCMAAQDNLKPDNTAAHARYTMKDLGTLGGPSSFLFDQPIGRFVNNHGTVAGASDTKALDPNAPNCASPDCHILHAFQWRAGILTDLGTLPGGHNSAAGWVNDRGVVMGGSDDGSVDPLTGLTRQFAVLWKDGRAIELGTLGGVFSFANAMNNRDQPVGIAQNTIPDPFSFLGVGTETRAVLWQDGTIRDLGDLGGPDSWGAFINDSGQIVGWSYTNSTPNPSTGIPTQHPFLWENGRMRDLGTLGGTLAVVGSLSNSGGGAINNRGQVIGTSTLAGDQTIHPFLWERGVLHDLGTLGGTNAEPFWINDAGAVVGQSDLPGSGTQLHHGFLWQAGKRTDLGTVDGDPCSRALAINSQGQIVGASTDCRDYQHGFLWERGGPMTDLNTLIAPGSGMRVREGVYINDRGEIVGSAVLPNGDLHAVLLIPCNQGPCETIQDNPSGDMQSTEIRNDANMAPVPSIVRAPRGYSTGRRGTKQIGQ